MSIVSGATVVGDRYEIGQVIGRGGMGEVRHARDLRLDREVAVKFLRADLAAQPEARRRFEDEAHNAARLTHPNVVLVLDSGEHEGSPYLVMERLPGRTLKDELSEAALSPARATWIARDILAGLAAAHEIGIVHRDVSPRNILLTETGRAKLGDFGIAKAAEDPSVTVAGQVLGTPAYVAPERIRGEPATPASDVYGVGATLYEALAGVPPFRGDSAISIAHQVVSTRPERLEHVRPDVPLDLVAAIGHAMDPDSTRRPTADELGAALAGDARLLSETSTVAVIEAGAETIAVAAIPVPEDVSRFSNRRERRTLLVTVAVAFALGLLLLAASERSGSAGNPEKAQVTTVPTTAVTAPPTTAVVQARVSVTAKPAPRHHGHHGKD